MTVLPSLFPNNTVLPPHQVQLEKQQIQVQGEPCNLNKKVDLTQMLKATASTLPASLEKSYTLENKVLKSLGAGLTTGAVLFGAVMNLANLNLLSHRSGPVALLGVLGTALGASGRKFYLLSQNNKAADNALLSKNSQANEKTTSSPSQPPITWSKVAQFLETGLITYGLSYTGLFIASIPFHMNCYGNKCDSIILGAVSAAATTLAIREAIIKFRSPQTLASNHKIELMKVPSTLSKVIQCLKTVLITGVAFLGIGLNLEVINVLKPYDGSAELFLAGSVITTLAATGRKFYLLSKNDQVSEKTTTPSSQKSAAWLKASQFVETKLSTLGTFFTKIGSTVSSFTRPVRELRALQSIKTGLKTYALSCTGILFAGFPIFSRLARSGVKDKEIFQIILASSAVLGTVEMIRKYLSPSNHQPLFKVVALSMGSAFKDIWKGKASKKQKAAIAATALIGVAALGTVAVGPQNAARMANGAVDEAGAFARTTWKQAKQAYTSFAYTVKETHPTMGDWIALNTVDEEAARFQDMLQKDPECENDEYCEVIPPSCAEILNTCHLGESDTNAHRKVARAKLKIFHSDKFSGKKKDADQYASLINSALSTIRDENKCPGQDTPQCDTLNKKLDFTVRYTQPDWLLYKKLGVSSSCQAVALDESAYDELSPDICSTLFSKVSV